jgi:small conductance mechanosensitive channel
MADIIDILTSLFVTYGLNILGAIIIFLIGRWVAGIVSRLLRKVLNKANVNETLINFAANVVYIGIIVFAVLAAFERLGVETTSFIAVLGAAGLAVGLALQGALANFAAGVLILLFKPFEIGNLVEASGTFGKVEEIQIFNTIIVTPDNKTVIVPNAQITSGNIVNYSKKGLLRLDMVFGIGYNDDLLKAKRILEEIVTADERVANDPPPNVAVMELADSSVNFTVRPYVKVEDYWGVHFDMTERVKLRFDQEGISIPFPQQDVHLFQPS